MNPKFRVLVYSVGLILLSFSWGSMSGERLSAQNVEEQALTREQTEQHLAETWERLTDAMQEQLERELSENVIKAGSKSMRLLTREFGENPSTGRALYLSMHGGGNAPPRLNDQQWRNQIRLYQPEDALYIAPRAPTNTWNLWHESHIDELFDRLILACVVCRNVDPNRVYLMGYSAGGDGVFQLAPRMSDRWAAVAMMAGHPNETQPDGLRNLPFALFMGGRDAAYDRNKLAEAWKVKLQELADQDPEGYPHWVQIYPEKGHWMDGADREALPWMAEKRRRNWPRQVVWRQDDVTHERLYWLGVAKEEAKGGSLVTATVTGQRIEIEADVERLKLYLHDELVDLDQPVTVRWNGQEVFHGKVARTRSAIEKSLNQRFDRYLAASAILELEVPK